MYNKILTYLKNYMKVYEIIMKLYEDYMKLYEDYMKKPILNILMEISNGKTIKVK